MDYFPWIPIGSVVNEHYKTSTLIESGDDYQIIALDPVDKKALVLNTKCHMSSLWLPILEPLIDLKQVITLSFGSQDYFIWLINQDEPIHLVKDIPQVLGALDSRDLMFLARAIRQLPQCSWGNSLYFKNNALCLPLDNIAESFKDKKKLAIKLMTGGVADLNMNIRQIVEYNSWLTISDIEEFLRYLGVNQSENTSHNHFLTTFKLPGRSELERFLNEYIIDYYNEQLMYEEMSVKPPNGLLLYGPPGTGKTYAVKQLAKFLQWPVRIIDFGSVGSPYIHQTGLRLKQEFELAAKEAPSIIIMDEIDAMGTSRNNLEHHTQIEEISELLRLLETSAENNVLVIATTNRIESIDHALLRKGRFDYHLKVDYASHDEIKEVLMKELNSRKYDINIDLSIYIEKLYGRPLSDIAWFIHESARLAVRHKRKIIDSWCMDTALSRIE